MTPLPDQLLPLLQQTFGSKVEVAHSLVANSHRDYLVLLVQLRHPAIEIVIKLAGPDAQFAGPFDRSAMLTRLVAAQTSIPMPEILAADETSQTWPWRYLIRTSIQGQEWMQVRELLGPEELADGYYEIGNAVAQLHSIQFPDFGTITLSGSVQGYEQFLPSFTEHVQSALRNPRLQDLFFSVLDSNKHIFQSISRPCLCHEDLHGHNILFNVQDGRWRLATILDFDKTWAGHNEIDLARLELWRGMTTPDFWRGYQADATCAPLYDQRRQVYQLLWCFEYARPTLEHIRDTQRLCIESGLSGFDPSLFEIQE